MAKQTRVNLLPATASVALFELMEFLRDDLGFTIGISGDGVSLFDNTGTSVITSGGVGGGGLNNADAHFTAIDPNGEYEWCVQRNATSRDWEVVVSALDGFTGGGISARPTATDEDVLVDAVMFPIDGTFRWHMSGNDVPIGDAGAAPVEVYPWRAFSTRNGTFLRETFIYHEPMKVGSYPPLVGTRAVPTTGEPDPSVYHAVYDASGDLPFRVDSIGWGAPGIYSPRSWWCMNGVNGQVEAMEIWQGAAHNANQSNADQFAPASVSGQAGFGPDPRDGSDQVVDFMVGRVARLGTNIGGKGISGTMLLKTVDRQYPDTMDIDGERFVYMGDFLLEWENGISPL